MKLTTEKGSENYAAQVITLPAKQKVVGLDNLVRVSVFGNDCLIGKDSPENELYLFFPAESALGMAYCYLNNLYRDSETNLDKKQKGFFEATGRVKALKFKGVISTGFVIPLKSLESWNQTDIKKLKVGDEFTSIDGHVLCYKYKITYQQGEKKTKESRFNKKLERFDKLVPNQFRFHESTSHLAKNLHLFAEDDVIVITDKWHGTSAVFSNVLVNKELTLKEKIAKWFGVKVVDKVYDNLYSSRSVLKNQYINKDQKEGGYYGEDIWGTVNKELDGKIEQGITIYGEIVGYLPSGAMIQKDYDYGCKQRNILDLPEGTSKVDVSKIMLYSEHKFLVYRITYTKPDGNHIELSWQQIKDYCAKHSLETVRELYFGQSGLDGQDEVVRENFLLELQSQHLEMKCIHCKNDVWAEGICVRIDGKTSYQTFKLKSKNFLERETKDLDKGEVSVEEEN